MNYLDRLENVGPDFLTAEDRMALSRDLAPTLNTEGWKAITIIVKRMRQEALEDRSPDKSRDYCWGKVDALDELGRILVDYIEQGQRLMAEPEKKKKVVNSPFKAGAGGF